jgi:hypothetical protein
MITPQTVDFYSRYMAELFDEKDVISVSTVWQSFFGRPQNSGSKTIYSPDSEVVDIDIMRGNERVAALIHRGTDSRDLNTMRNTVTQNYSSFSRVYPLAEELGDITASQINKRMAGEDPYNGKARAERTRMLAREHHMEHIRRYVRLFEVLAGFSLLGGQMPAILGTTNADLLYDFNRNAAHLITPAIPWDQAGADILGDIDAGCRLLRENGKVKPNFIFLGQDVASVFFNDTTIQQLADVRGYEFIRAGMSNFVMDPGLQPLVDGGAIPRGAMVTPEGFRMTVFTYVDIVTDAAGLASHLMPLTSAFMGYYGARCDRYFGPPERLPLVSADLAWYQEMFGMNLAAPIMPGNIRQSAGVVSPDMFYCDAYLSGDRKKVTIRTQSAPIFATTQTDAFVTFLSLTGRRES